MFRGLHNVTMDSKGRIAVPAKHRDVLSKLIVVPNPMPGESCLLVYPIHEWEQVEADIVSRPNSGSVRQLKRLFLGQAVEYVLDGHGRVLLTPSLREFAGLDKKLVMVGQGNKFELWDESAWTALRDGEVDDGAAFVEELESLSF
ncbi:division/cell wall cluster transcriptional repressor MraZ [Ostreibacterium oceani]|uniref:Transcriptional regulator MraZ n=1 Tax=Ostreibacterium oceani TaxID=2654998 RepID=A0A6N7ETX1_9GAMM|nr:division/cell wall cluster transcriptional repressor MraZ [Ostreibacterium oceani]MPV86264.1 division/cell wall cluster transcriptional repressor MraZ [Ostreibacterium oceani]